MTKLEYIKESHKQANHKAWSALDRVYLRLKGRSILLAYVWKPIAWSCFGVVWVVSWIAYTVDISRDVKYSIHFMECDIAKQNLDNNKATVYLEEKQSEYKRQLSYGNYTHKQQEKINHTFEFLFSKYPITEPEIINPQLTSIENLTHESLAKIDTFAVKIEPVSEYAKIRLDKELKEAASEAKLQKEQEKRQQQIAQTLPDFESKLNDRHIAILTEYINEAQLFSKHLSEKDVANIFACKLRKPLQIAKGKSRLLIYLFVQLFAWNYICIEWQSVCEKNKLFLSSKESKILSSGNISSVANQVNDLPPRNHAIIDNYVNQLKQA